MMSYYWNKFIINFFLGLEFTLTGVLKVLFFLAQTVDLSLSSVEDFIEQRLALINAIDAVTAAIGSVEESHKHQLQKTEA